MDVYMNCDFVKLGKLMAQTEYDPHFYMNHDNAGVSLEELRERYHARLEQQQQSLEKELKDLETNIIELQQKNNVLRIMLDEKLGKRVNHKMYNINSEKIRLNESTITHLQSTREQVRIHLIHLIHLLEKGGVQKFHLLGKGGVQKSLL
jgi:predicted RNase H-like nuclease (RuvC/YqgF family)